MVCVSFLMTVSGVEGGSMYGLAHRWKDGEVSHLDHNKTTRRALDITQGLS